MLFMPVYVVRSDRPGDLMSATIVYAPQFKDVVLAQMDRNVISLIDLAAKFPDKHIENVRYALNTLRKFGAVDCKAVNCMGAKVWWRV